MKKATIGDVAEAAGVSVKTVSRVLNNEKGVKELTRDKVQSVISKMDYRPNLNARSLRTKQSYLIGMLYVDYSGNFYSNLLLTGAIETCDALGYDLLLRPLKTDIDGYRKTIEYMHERSKPDGYIIAPPLCDNALVLQTLDKLDAPYILIAPKEDRGSRSLRCNERAATKTAIKHLISLGHTDIAIINHLVGHGAGQWRYEGYVDALTEAGLPIKDCYIEQEQHADGFCESAARRLLLRDQPPSAIFTTNDTAAAIVYRVASQLGKRIPYDLSIVGFDDDPMAENLWPPLTTVKQPIENMGKIAANILIKEMITKVETYPEPNINCEFIVRSSSGPCLPK